MSTKRTNVLWAISLFLIGAATILLTGSVLLNTKLPDFVIRILGFSELIGLFLLLFSTVKKLQTRA